MRAFWIWALALGACDSATAVIGPIDDGTIDDGESITDEAGEDGETEDGRDPDEEEPDVEEDPEEDPDTEEDPERDRQRVVPGVWVPTNVEVLEDPCNWVELVEELFGVEFLSLLPEAFEVRGWDGGFQIEAIDYGAAGPIECGFVGPDFGCEQQSVSPTALGLGLSGWEYAIDFYGQAPDAQTIQGVASVLYPSTDEGTAFVLELSGIDIETCAQVFVLDLALEE